MNVVQLFQKRTISHWTMSVPSTPKKCLELDILPQNIKDILEYLRYTENGISTYSLAVGGVHIDREEVLYSSQLPWTLFIHRCRLEDLSALRNVEHLHLAQCWGFTDLSTLEKCNIRRLTLEDTSVMDVTSIAGGVEVLELFGREIMVDTTLLEDRTRVIRGRRRRWQQPDMSLIETILIGSLWGAYFGLIVMYIGTYMEWF